MLRYAAKILAQVNIIYLKKIINLLNSHFQVWLKIKYAMSVILGLPAILENSEPTTLLKQSNICSSTERNYEDILKGAQKMSI